MSVGRQKKPAMGSRMPTALLLILMFQGSLWIVSDGYPIPRGEESVSNVPYVESELLAWIRGLYKNSSSKNYDDSVDYALDFDDTLSKSRTSASLLDGNVAIGSSPSQTKNKDLNGVKRSSNASIVTTFYVPFYHEIIKALKGSPQSHPDETVDKHLSHISGQELVNETYTDISSASNNSLHFSQVGHVEEAFTEHIPLFPQNESSKYSEEEIEVILPRIIANNIIKQFSVEPSGGDETNPIEDISTGDQQPSVFYKIDNEDSISSRVTSEAFTETSSSPGIVQVFQVANLSFPRDHFIPVSSEGSAWTNISSLHTNTSDVRFSIHREENTTGNIEITIPVSIFFNASNVTFSSSFPKPNATKLLNVPSDLESKMSVQQKIENYSIDDVTEILSSHDPGTTALLSTPIISTEISQHTESVTKNEMPYVSSSLQESHESFTGTPSDFSIDRETTTFTPTSKSIIYDSSDFADQYTVSESLNNGKFISENIPREDPLRDFSSNFFIHSLISTTVGTVRPIEDTSSEQHFQQMSGNEHIVSSEPGVNNTLNIDQTLVTNDSNMDFNHDSLVPFNGGGGELHNSNQGELSWTNRMNENVESSPSNNLGLIDAVEFPTMPHGEPIVASQGLITMLAKPTSTFVAQESTESDATYITEKVINTTETRIPRDIENSESENYFVTSSSSDSNVPVLENYLSETQETEKQNHHETIYFEGSEVLNTTISLQTTENEFEVFTSTHIPLNEYSSPPQYSTNKNEDSLYDSTTRNALFTSTDVSLPTISNDKLSVLLEDSPILTPMTSKQNILQDGGLESSDNVSSNLVEDMPAFSTIDSLGLEIVGSYDGAVNESLAFLHLLSQLHLPTEEQPLSLYVPVSEMYFESASTIISVDDYNVTSNDNPTDNSDLLLSSDYDVSSETSVDATVRSDIDDLVNRTKESSSWNIFSNSVVNSRDSSSSAGFTLQMPTNTFSLEVSPEVLDQFKEFQSNISQKIETSSYPKSNETDTFSRKHLISEVIRGKHFAYNYSFVEEKDENSASSLPNFPKTNGIFSLNESSMNTVTATSLEKLSTISNVLMGVTASRNFPSDSSETISSQSFLKEKYKIPLKTKRNSEYKLPSHTQTTSSTVSDEISSFFFVPLNNFSSPIDFRKTSPEEADGVLTAVSDSSATYSSLRKSPSSTATIETNHASEMLEITETIVDGTDFPRDIANVLTTKSPSDTYEISTLIPNFPRTSSDVFNEYEAKKARDQNSSELSSLILRSQQFTAMPSEELVNDTKNVEVETSKEGIIHESSNLFPDIIPGRSFDNSPSSILPSPLVVKENLLIETSNTEFNVDSKVQHHVDELLQYLSNFPKTTQITKQNLEELITAIQENVRGTAKESSLEISNDRTTMSSTMPTDIPTFDNTLPILITDLIKGSTVSNIKYDINKPLHILFTKLISGSGQQKSDTKNLTKPENDEDSVIIKPSENPASILGNAIKDGSEIISSGFLEIISNVLGATSDIAISGISDLLSSDFSEESTHKPTVVTYIGNSTSNVNLPFKEMPLEFSSSGGNILSLDNSYTDEDSSKFMKDPVDLTSLTTHLIDSAQKTIELTSNPSIVLEVNVNTSLNMEENVDTTVNATTKLQIPPTSFGIKYLPQNVPMFTETKEETSEKSVEDGEIMGDLDLVNSDLSTQKYSWDVSSSDTKRKNPELSDGDSILASNYSSITEPLSAKPTYQQVESEDDFDEFSHGENKWSVMSGGVTLYATKFPYPGAQRVVRGMNESNSGRLSEAFHATPTKTMNKTSTTPFASKPPEPQHYNFATAKVATSSNEMTPMMGIQRAFGTNFRPFSQREYPGFRRGPWKWPRDVVYRRRVGIYG